jgi:hypothetical protein
VRREIEPVFFEMPVSLEAVIALSLSADRRFVPGGGPSPAADVV